MSMSNYQIHLRRSHYDAIAVCAANTASAINEGTPDDWNETGWFTPFDGGGNVHYPSDFVSVFAEASLWGKEDGHEPVLYAMVVIDAWSQDRFRACSFFLRLKGFGADDLSGRSWLDLVESASSSNEEWEGVAEADVPEHARKVMEKSIATVRGLFGQGGDFFEV